MYTCGHTLGCGQECEREATHVTTVFPAAHTGPSNTTAAMIEMFVCGPHARAMKQIYGAEIRRIS